MNRHPLGALMAIGSACAVLASCGSSGHLGSGGRGTDAQLAFARCMRSHGVSGFPDPNAPGSASAGPSNSFLGFILPPTMNPGAPTFKAAAQLCLHRMIGNRPRPPRSNNTGAQLKFAECMRANGVPNYPDPQPPPLSGPIESFGPSVNLDTPAAKHAASVCGASP